MKVENTHLSWLLNQRNLGLIAENRDLNWIRLLLFITSVCQFLIWLLGSLHIWKAAQRNEEQRIPDKDSNKSLQQQN